MLLKLVFCILSTAVNNESNEPFLRGARKPVAGASGRLGSAFSSAGLLTLSISIANMSDKGFSGMDIALMNDYGTIYNPSIFGDTRLVFSQFKPGDRRAGKISFAVDNIKQSYWLIVNNRATNKPLMKISLDNAYKNVSEDIKKRNSKMKKRKKNFYKEEDVFDIK